jgi:hypothetical protein
VEKLTEIEQKIIHHIPIEVNYAFQNTVSFSQFSTHHNCPHQWYLQYAKNLAPYRATINTIFGDAMHETIQHFLTLLYKESVEKADELNLIEYFQDLFRAGYREEFDKTKIHFSSADEMGEFFDDATEILNWFKQHRKKFFQNKKIKLLGIELPLVVQLNKSLFLKGYVDIILYDEEEDMVYIYDIKTSAWGWGDKAKKDETKIAQLLLYKEFLTKQYGLEIDKIDVQFFVLRRKIYENSQYEIPRVQIVKPASGKIKRKKIMERFGEFIKECYNEEGKIMDKEYEKRPSAKGCGYCPFSNKPELCDKKKS